MDPSSTDDEATAKERSATDQLAQGASTAEDSASSVVEEAGADQRSRSNEDGTVGSQLSGKPGATTTIASLAQWWTRTRLAQWLTRRRRETDAGGWAKSTARWTLVVALATVVAAVAASASAWVANTAAQTAKQQVNDQIQREDDAFDRRYAELVVFSTSTDKNNDRDLTVRNLGFLRITRPLLRVTGSDVVVPLLNVKACHSSHFKIDGRWYDSGETVELVFQDADGLWWSRAESGPIGRLAEAPRWGTGIPVGADGKQLKLKLEDEPFDKRIDPQRIPVDRATYEMNDFAQRSYRWYVLKPSKEDSRSSECQR